MRRLSALIVLGLEPVLSPEEQASVVVADTEFQGLISEAITWKRAHPADDLLTAMIDATDGTDRLSPEELISQVTLIYIAGHETTVNLISGGTLALLENQSSSASARQPGGRCHRDRGTAAVGQPRPHDQSAAAQRPRTQHR